MLSRVAEVQAVSSGAQSFPPGSPMPMVKFFAVMGVIIAAVFANTLIRWVLSPDFRPAPVGADPIPAVTLLLVHITDIFCGAVSLAALWFVVIRPWLRTRRLTWDGMLMLCLLTMWVQDPMCNYFNFTFMYNAYFVNMGSWTMELPGWQSPRGGNLPEPLLLMSGIYLWWTMLSVVVFSWTLKKCRVWLPGMSMLGHLPIAFAAICLLDVVLEIPAVWLGLFAYAGAPPALTLWAGHPYQFPIYETIFMNFNYFSIGLLRFFRDDKGESWAERGVGDLRLSARAKSVVRFFALLGFCNMSYFIVYFMPYNWMAMQAGTMPKYPSYMRVGICGQGTPYACPSREVPIPSRTSLAIAPDDPRLSVTARQN